MSNPQDAMLKEFDRLSAQMMALFHEDIRLIARMRNLSYDRAEARALVELGVRSHVKLRIELLASVAMEVIEEVVAEGPLISLSALAFMQAKET